MAVYKVNEARALLPVHYMEAGGALADHETDQNLLAVNSRNVPLESYQPVSRGTVFYTDAGSRDAAEKEAGEGGVVYYVTNEQYVKSHVNLGTFKEVKQEQRAAAPSSGGRKLQQKQASSENNDSK